MNDDARPGKIITAMVVVVIVFVSVYVLYNMLHDKAYYSVPSKAELISEMTKFYKASNDLKADEVKVVDRTTFYFVEQNFSENASISLDKSKYSSIFKSMGWREASIPVSIDGSLQYCKSNVLATLTFGEVKDNERNYTVTLTAGNNSFDVCG